MEQLKQAMQTMINISNEEFDHFSDACQVNILKKNDVLCSPLTIPNEIFFIKEGLIRVFINDDKGDQHTIHFALENQFIADYSNYILKKPGVYTLQAIEASELISIPRSAIEWGYANLKDGNKMGRLIAEYYFMYQDDRINSRYIKTPKERYLEIDSIFPNIHQRVPQHMIASYLGITPIHLSRLKSSKN
ncbi:MAG: Crp/Fnr family transcriptional regulator [Flavobacteriales bacterium]